MSKNMSFNDQRNLGKVYKPVRIFFCLLFLTRRLSMEKIQELLKGWKKRKNLSPITFYEAMVVHQSMQRMKSLLLRNSISVSNLCLYGKKDDRFLYWCKAVSF